MNVKIRKITVTLSLILALVLISTTVSALPSSYLGTGNNFESTSNWSGGSDIDFTSGQVFANYYAPTSVSDDLPDQPVSAVPEPTTIALLTMGLVGLGLLRRRQA